MRLVHLGLGNFFRAHQAWYTDRAGDGWGIAAFSGRSAELADALSAQDGLYTLVTRAPDGDRLEVIESLSRAYPAARHDAWLATVAAPDVRAMTITITEAGYAHGELQADADALRADRNRPRPHGARAHRGGALRPPARGRGPFTLIPCDNLPDNGAVVAAVVADLAELVEPGLRDWFEASVTTVTTMVDRITPRTTPADLVAGDRCSVVTEPFSEWVLSGRFAGGRPRWEDAGATFTEDIAPFEQRKLWLLNGGHSLLAYAGPARGHETVADAVADERCRAWLETWWTEASRASDAARRGARALSRGAARAVREPAHAAPAGPDRRRRLAEAADPDPARPAGRAVGRAHAGGRRARARGLDRPSARRRRAGQRPARGGAGRARRGPAAGGGPADPRWTIDPALAADDELIASVCDTV